MRRWYYGESICDFLNRDTEGILGTLAAASNFDMVLGQRDAWQDQIRILKDMLRPHSKCGSVYFEYSIPRLGKRIDVVLLIRSTIFVLEFKAGQTTCRAPDIDQVVDYALDLKNFHETSHRLTVAPILIPTAAKSLGRPGLIKSHQDGLLFPIGCSPAELPAAISAILTVSVADGSPDASHWEAGRYCPKPTIIEAASALYRGHSVADISRSDASATNLSRTSAALSEVIESAKTGRHKAICFVTGVPGAGKTLVGLDVATEHIDKRSELYSVFLSGNGPLVEILREALARDKVAREKQQGRKARKGHALSEVKLFIQNVHHFRDECLIDGDRPPIEHVAIFDEAQRAWDLQQTSSFMQRKRKRPDFAMSEPEFLVSCMDRHTDWAVVVCLVGGGQEINTGEAGISEWIETMQRRFPLWHIHISSRLTDTEYTAGRVLEQLRNRPNVTTRDELHLGVSMRSFRAENVSLLVKQMLDLEVDAARDTLAHVSANYPIVLTRSLSKAKKWLRDHARGSERYGIVVSSQAERLKPHAIHVKAPLDPVHWFLDGKEDVRSSYYLEDAATEFHVQGLELDWACVTWDADFRRAADCWDHWSFRGDRWNRIRKPQRQMYLKNAYRVLLTRARQGMAIVVPEGDPSDPTRKAEYYDPTFEYLSEIGLPPI
jgi:hypothetical protein